MIQPTNHLFKYIPGVKFDFRFQYLSGTAGSANPVNLNGYTPQWILTDASGTTTYVGTGTAGHSGIFYGGSQGDPTNGIIDLVLIANDTLALSSPATYQFSVTPSGGVLIPLLSGTFVISDPNVYVGSQPPPAAGVIDGGMATTNFTSTSFDGGVA